MHGIVVCAVPWARHRTRFTRAFEDQPNADAERQQPFLRRAGKLTERLLHTFGQRIELRLADLVGSLLYVAHGGSPVLVTWSHSSRSQQDRTRQEDRHLKFYELRDNLTFFAALKKELVHRRSWPTRQELTSEIFDYIEGFYNNSRRPSTLGYLSPAMFEEVSLPINNKNN